MEKSKETIGVIAFHSVRAKETVVLSKDSQFDNQNVHSGDNAGRLQIRPSPGPTSCPFHPRIGGCCAHKTSRSRETIRRKHKSKQKPHCRSSHVDPALVSCTFFPDEPAVSWSPGLIQPPASCRSGKEITTYWFPELKSLFVWPFAPAKT